MVIYRKLWWTAALSVLALGLLVAAAGLAMAAPFTTLVLLVLGVVLTRVVHRLPGGVRRLAGRYVSAEVATPDVRATAALPVVTIACVGLDALLGPAGLELALLVLLTGVPLLLPPNAPLNAPLTVADILAGQAASGRVPEPTMPQPAAPPPLPQIPAQASGRGHRAVAGRSGPAARPSSPTPGRRATGRC